MPVFNVEKYIYEAITSILWQSHKEWTAVIVDDGSSDRTAEIVGKFVKQDSRIILIRNEVNSGIVDTLNEGLRYCEGPFVARFDGDDVMLPNKLERQLLFLKERGDIALVGSDVYTISENGRKQNHKVFPSASVSINKSMHFFNPILHCWLARTDLYKALGGYRAIDGAEDYDFLARGAISGFQYASIPEPLIKIRKREGNTTSSRTVEQRKSFIFVNSMIRKSEVLNYNDKCWSGQKNGQIDRYAEAAKIAANFNINGTFEFGSFFVILRSRQFIFEFLIRKFVIAIESIYRML